MAIRLDERPSMRSWWQPQQRAGGFGGGPNGSHIGATGRARRRWNGASVGSAIAFLAVLFVISVYGFARLRGTPEVAAMDPAARLAALRSSRLSTNNAARLAVNHGRNAQHDSSANAIDSALPTKLELTAAAVEARPVEPRAIGMERAGVLPQGSTLESALTGLYIHGDAAKQVAKAFAELRNPRRLRPGTRLLARFDGQSALDAFSLREVVIAPAGPVGNITVTREGEGAATRYVAKEGGIPGEIVRRVLRCGIRDSLSASLTRCGHDDALVHLVATVLSERLDLARDLRAGDELRVVFDELVAAGERVRIESVHAIDYRSGATRFTALRFDNGHGAVGWFRPDADSFASFFLHDPVLGARFTSGYGMRMHPILLKMRPHLGIDLAAPTGTPVRAIADGIVSTASRSKVAGRYIKLKHARGYGSDYLHLSRLSRAARAGARVRRGEVIGYVGTSGRSTAPHLHLGVRKGKAHIDPVSVRDEAGSAVGAKDRPSFDEVAQALMRLLDAVEGGPEGT